MKSNSTTAFLQRFHIIPKLVCLLLGFIIWLYVMETESPDYEHTFENVSITIIGKNELEKEKYLSIYSEYNIPVDVTVNGKRSVISKYSSNDITITVDVSDVTESKKYDFDLSFDLPSGLSFVDASMETISLYIDQYDTNTVELRTSIKSYKLSTEYVLGEIKADADYVTVSGPKSYVDEIEYALVEVNMGDNFLTQSLTTDGVVLLYNHDDENIESRHLKVSKTSANISIPVYSTKEVSLTAEGKYGFYNKANSKITITPAKIKVMGEPSVLKELESIKLTDINEKKTVDDPSEFESDIELPAGIMLVSGQPAFAKVHVEHIGLSTKEFNVKNIEVINPDKIEYTLLDTAITVLVRGDSSTIRMLDAENIKITVDLSGYKENMGEVRPVATVTFNVDKGTVYELESYTVRVLIK
ncbi:MAG: hypothetical protein E7575_04285 [Ruminococcaceae bacterium]|nr:hypothetical protein [Oscillospiraceae bacterium]